MYKMIFGSKRKPGMSMEDFRAYWLGPHAEKARRVPGIRRYVINLLADLGGSGRELPYDGFAEAWFDSEDDLRRSGRSDELKAVLADEVNLFDLSTRWSVIVEEHVMIDGGQPVHREELARQRGARELLDAPLLDAGYEATGRLPTREEIHDRPVSRGHQPPGALPRDD